MLLYRTNLGERINLDLVERVMERPEAIELHMVSGTTRIISGAGVVALQATLAGYEAKAPAPALAPAPNPASAPAPNPASAPASACASEVM